MHNQALPVERLALEPGRPFLIEAGDDIRRLVAEALVDPWLLDSILREKAFNEKRLSKFLFAERIGLTIPANTWVTLFDFPELEFPPLEAGVHIQHVGTGTAGVGQLRFSIYDFKGGVQPRPFLYHSLSWGAPPYNSDDMIHLPFGAHGLRVDVQGTTAKNPPDFRLIVHPFRVNKQF